MKTGKYWTLFDKGNIDGLAMFWDTTDFCMKLLKTEWKVNQQEGEEEFKCYMIWQMMVALLHSNWQLRTERDGDTEKGCQNLLYSRRLLMMMTMTCLHCVSGHFQCTDHSRAMVTIKTQLICAGSAYQITPTHYPNPVILMLCNRDNSAKID